MKREIKFRAWDKKNKKWIHDTEHACNILGEVILCGGWMNGVRLQDLNEIEVMQYTGLKDKNGKEVFEGDIVQTYYNETKTINGEIAVIKYLENSFVMAQSDDDEKMDCVWFYTYVVIGNIHESPELIK